MADTRHAERATPTILRFERLLDASVGRVWQYLVGPDLPARWIMDGPTAPRVGGSIGLTMDHDRLSDQDVPTPECYGPCVGHSWSERITRCEPPNVLAFTWENGDAGEVTIELDDAGNDQTRLVLTHTGLRGRSDALNFGGGWHSYLVVLDRRIPGKGVDDFWVLLSRRRRGMVEMLSETGDNL